MKKNYVLDTNVLLHDPQAIFRFEDNTVFIPIFVIEEVDQFKREGSERGRNARTVSRLLDGLRERNGSLADGVPLDNGGFLRVVLPQTRGNLAVALDPTNADHAILQTAIDVQKSFPDHRTVLVTMDTNLRIRADALGVTPENYESQRVQIDQLDTGAVEITVSDETIDTFYEKHELPLPPGMTLNPNVFVQLRGSSDAHGGLGRWDASRQRIMPLRSVSDVMGIRPRNREQTFALDLLLDENIKLVTLVGKAGTGKTLLALAAALKRTIDEGAYSRVLVSRPIIPLGRDIGFLPGSVDEKLNPWLQPIFDNLELLISASSNKKNLSMHKLIQEGFIQVEPLTYIRGRSLPHQFLVVDEAQNLTPHEVKTIITRSGEGTKVVLTGDPYQIDNPYVDSASNGLTIVTDRFKQEKVAGHVVLSRGERSELAELASNLL
ncbi:MAG TPA: PhoH family protein [Polyangiaceae bacterium]|jgi:PhoH-like ATPase|nr:MAG: PhoH-like protein [Deltaproteobacteria bacterium ADurb.Bin207]HNS97454.1 PhoH family protein [Polyangiaceae bacterium]HNZ21661.1 PhoH family protein [Polyangiaceae bacterium]HOD24190.1 PhoH family protein [Polyangiaceae bacterium]HOE48618.1 PhoH family protein [Polyangiaceae bacterium]